MSLPKLRKGLFNDDRFMLSLWIISLSLYPFFIVIYSEFCGNIFVKILFCTFVISNITFLAIIFSYNLKRIFKRGTVLQGVGYMILLILNLVISAYVLCMWYVRLRELDLL